LKHKIPWLTITAVTLAIVCIAVIYIGVYGYIKLDNRVRALEFHSSQSTASDLQSAIDFLKDQIQILIWLLGVIIAAAGAILAFLGIETRKSIEEKYDNIYLKLLADKDGEAFKKQIVFLYKDSDDIIGFRNEIRERGYNTNLIKSSALDIISKLSDASIVIYRVDSNSDTLYEGIADWCDSKGIHCILYCPGIHLPSTFMSKKLSYMSTSQQIAKLRESLFTLLYLAP
jgi:hypothetical protein